MLLHSIPEKDFTLFYYDNHSSFDVFLDYLEKYIDAGPTRDELFFFGADASLVTPAQTRLAVPIAARAVTVRPPGAKTALLFGRDSLYGLGRLYQAAEHRIFRRPWVTQLFRNLDDAAAWLQLEPGLIAEIIHSYSKSGLPSAQPTLT